MKPKKRRRIEPIGPDAKARPLLDRPAKVAPRFRGAAIERAKELRFHALGTGNIRARDYTPSGRVSAIVFGTTGPQGGISTNPAVALSYWVRRKLRPLRVAPVTVTDGEGRPIATVTTDPVTGKRTRTAL